MKAIFKIIGTFLLIAVLGSCEKNESDLLAPTASNTDTVKGKHHFNNGMLNQYSHRVVIQWNELLSRSIDNSMPQPAEVKIYAMFTLAIHDALNNVVPKYETYALNNLHVTVDRITHKNIHSIADAAVSKAARDMIAQLFPPATAAADQLLNSILSEIKDADLKTRGIAIGASATAAVLAKRANDFPLAFAAHVGPTGPGQHQSNYLPWVNATPNWPANAVYAPNLGSLTPFGIESGDQFRNEVPYALNSREYIADYKETKALGCAACPARTPEQTQIGAFWVENTSSSMNRLARALIVRRKLDGWEAARLLALVEMSQVDAYIASFDGKYHFNFWRPITAIRAGDADGVKATKGDPTWSTTFFTPPTPEFPSTHAYNAGAAAAVFKSFFKSDNLNMHLSSPYYLVGVERHFKTFSQMAHENAISRIYIGYHFRYSVEVGLRQGYKLGYYVYEHNLRELKKVL